jgi:hypothetical protein
MQTVSTTPVPIPIAPFPAGIMALQYQPATYDVAPPASMPVMEPLPKERTMLKEQQRRTRILEKEQRYESEKHYHKQTGGGFFKKMGTAIKGAAVAIEKGVGDFSSEVHKGYINVTHETFDSEYRRLFRLPWEERLWDAFYCRCITGPAMFTHDGILFISDNYLCFSAERKKDRLSFMIPLRNIVSILPANVTGKKEYKTFVAAPLATLSTRGLMVYTNDHTMHRFYGFGDGSRDVFNVLDHAWRASYNRFAPAPLPIAWSMPFPERPYSTAPTVSVPPTVLPQPTHSVTTTVYPATVIPSESVTHTYVVSGAPTAGSVTYK